MKHNLIRLALLGTWLYGARRYYRNWGATKEECKTTLPGDELVRAPAAQTTGAISIDAAIDEVWPWLVQIGQDRAGLYSFETLGNLIGLRLHNADRIHPKWQRLDIDDAVRLAPSGWMGLRDGVALRVVDLVPQQRIVLRAASPELPWDVVWSFHIMPHWKDRCRLIIRLRSGLRHPGEILAAEFAGPVTALLTRGMMIGIKRRAETHPASLKIAGAGAANVV
ncbi:hypothetical protein A5707_10135 [Mycobacterium kyorinense]|uniref:SRPBCC family protein n=2 Tax=Mycobacterium kyorinense TaxID=487514 RepID=A0A1A2YPV8_9MYCO|nr:hypothetical protein A5707_10135 [Mycobacterium kyorinense]